MNGMNIGAFVDSLRPRTKKALSAAIAEGATVTFDTTSIFDQQGTYTLETLPRNVIHFGVGPDPYTNRRWYFQLVITDEDDATWVKFK
jgi:hypothetical protein